MSDIRFLVTDCLPQDNQQFPHIQCFSTYHGICVEFGTAELYVVFGVFLYCRGYGFLCSEYRSLLFPHVVDVSVLCICSVLLCYLD